MPINAIYIGVFWMLYYTIHSTLASQWAKKFFSQSMPSLYRWYRLFFSVFSAVNFFLLAWFHLITPSKPAFISTLVAKIIGVFISILALVVFVLAFRQYDLKVWYSDQSKQEYQLLTSGINKLVRHPLYFSAILGLIAMVLIFPLWKNVIFAIISLIYIVIGALLEEQKLIQTFGDEYRKYRMKTKMLIPFLI